MSEQGQKESGKTHFECRGHKFRMPNCIRRRLDIYQHCHTLLHSRKPAMLPRIIALPPSHRTDTQRVMFRCDINHMEKQGL